MNESAIIFAFVVLLLLAAGGLYSWERKHRRSALMRWVTPCYLCVGRRRGRYRVPSMIPSPSNKSLH